MDQFKQKDEIYETITGKRAMKTKRARVYTTELNDRQPPEDEEAVEQPKRPVPYSRMASMVDTGGDRQMKEDEEERIRRLMEEEAAEQQEDLKAESILSR